MYNSGRLKMQTTFTDEVSVINQTLAEKIGQQKYRVWFKNSTKFVLTGNCLTIGVPNHFIGNWVENHFLDDISFAVRRVTGAEKRIVFNIDPQLSGAQKRNLLDSQAELVKKTQHFGFLGSYKKAKPPKME